MPEIKLELNAKPLGLLGFWLVELTIAGVNIWSSDAFKADDEYQALGIGVDIFARQFGFALRGDDE